MRRLFLPLALALLASAAGATTLVPRTLPSLVAHADQVVEGRVVARRSVEDMRLIFTEYQVEVTDWLKQGPDGEPRAIVIRQPGGTVGDMTMSVEGAAHFAVGDEVLLFTKDYGGQGHQQVANLAQGALAVVSSPGVAPGTRVRRSPAAAAFPGGAPDDLDALKARIRALVAGAQP